MATQLDLIPPPSIALQDVFQAYADCRRNKRRTANAMAFEVDYEARLVRLCKQLNDGTYRPGRSLAFIVNRPVKREIFAAAFRDRVVHHLVINKLNPYFEREFIYDSYACRKGKGTHFGIARVQRFLRRCSAGGTREAHVLKLDIRGFFMSINRGILFDRLSRFVRSHYQQPDRELVVQLCRRIIHQDPARNCVIRGDRADWEGLPSTKSLFGARAGCGLPIGNLTSQVFANFYLTPFDHFVKHTLGVRYYGRYVDDMVFVDTDGDRVRALVPRVRRFLAKTLGLQVHPRKIYLQPARHGVAFLGTHIKASHICTAARTKGNFASSIAHHNAVVEDHKPGAAERDAFRSSINSYLGIMSHYATWRLRRRMLARVSPWWRRWFVPSPDARRIVPVPVLK